MLKPEDHVLDGSEKKLTRLASCGRPVVNYEVRIVDKNDHDVPIGEVGEIIARSEAMMSGYWQMPEQTSSKLRDGWLHTGDLGRMDEDGYVYMVERKDDLSFPAASMSTPVRLKRSFTDIRLSQRPLS